MTLSDSGSGAHRGPNIPFTSGKSGSQLWSFAKLCRSMEPVELELNPVLGMQTCIDVCTGTLRVLTGMHH